MDVAGLQNAVLNADKSQFDALALEVFTYQSVHCPVYRQYLDYLQLSPSKINNTQEIPYLPIEFFKNFEVKTGTYDAELVFESSSTTGTGISKHFVNSKQAYIHAFTKSFEYAFGDASRYCHLALLPSYLERQNSSLVFQVAAFIENSVHKTSAFYLHNHRDLMDALHYAEEHKIPTILWGVSFALLDFIEHYRLPLKHTMVIETGGMKGRRKEITRDELHSELKQVFQTSYIAGEYGMTELLSQAYAQKDGLYIPPPWMQIFTREINDPFSEAGFGKHGAINIADLANVHSCAFIATSDLGKVYSDGSFEVLGRIDYSDTRGCNLLI